MDDEVWMSTRVAEKDNLDASKRKGRGGINVLVLPYDKIVSFPNVEALNSEDVYCIYKDDKGALWISTTSDGVYRYYQGSFEHYDVPVSIMSMLNDSEGRMWLAGAGGLYRITDQRKIINITTAGPWE